MIKKLIFFLGDFHNGAINHGLHFIGFTLLGYGLGVESWWIVVLSPFVMEMGHIYNYITGRDRHLAFRIIPAQIVAGLIFAGIVYLLTRAFV